MSEEEGTYFVWFDLFFMLVFLGFITVEDRYSSTYMKNNKNRKEGKKEGGREEKGR